MRRALVAGNWKMNGSAATARALAERAGAMTLHNVDVALCAPFPYLALVAQIVADTPVSLGAQDVAQQPPGAFTGAVAAEMLADVGCATVIVGHSERRALFNESDDEVAAKFQRAKDCGLTPILCVGETLAQREAGGTEAVVTAQLDAVLTHCGVSAKSDWVLAYEPVWAIGTGKTASAEQAQHVHKALRQRLADAGADADGIRILYGGSVKPGNAGELFAMADIDGGLIGGAALDADDFQAICEAAEG